jgi:NAD(P)-dependent dehydrogenase (short-subunit alcohol dehydrogenase family)
MPTSVVTGATGGIGRFIALGLLQAGHRLIIVGRDPGRGNDALRWLRAQAPSARIELELADLSLLAETRALAQRILDRHPIIDRLVNNAGVFSAQREETREGHERVIAVNYLSPFVLTQALLPALLAAGVARIVNVGSSTSDHARIDVTDLECRRRWGMVRAYGQSKLALGMATFAWARRLRESGVTVNVVHPGTVATGLVREKGAIGLAWRIMAPFALTEEEGADTPLHVTLSSDFAGITGAYVKKRRAVRTNKLMMDEPLVERLWRETEALIRP